MNHFIVMNSLIGEPGPGMFRVRADRIDWMAEYTDYTLVSVCGKEFKVEEPINEILSHIEDPTLIYRFFPEYKRPDPMELEKKYRNGFKRALEIEKIPCIPYPGQGGPECR